jgi:transposase
MLHCRWGNAIQEGKLPGFHFCRARSQETTRRATADDHPGVGPLTALAFVSIIGTPSRFQRGKQVGNYVGMIASEESSAGKQRLGHISKRGNSLLRFLLVEAAQAAACIHPDWRRRYIRLAVRRHKSSAKVAMGRRLGVRLYWMWRNGCAYSPSLEFASYVGQLGTGHGGK